jgi:hypothetical protein
MDTTATARNTRWHVEIVKNADMRETPENFPKCGTKIVCYQPIGPFYPNPECEMLDGPFNGSDPLVEDKPDRRGNLRK